MQVFIARKMFLWVDIAATQKETETFHSSGFSAFLGREDENMKYFENLISSN